MKGLTKEHLAFFKLHNVALDRVFDSEGLPPIVYKPKMKSMGKLIAFNVSPCRIDIRPRESLRDVAANQAEL